jgi:uncharacterized protein
MLPFLKSCFFEGSGQSTFQVDVPRNHFEENTMKCPSCPDIELTMSERQGVEIDYCAQCRGVWLDRGELDKLIERAATLQGSESQGVRTPSQNHNHRHPQFVDSDHDHSRSYSGKRQKSWLSHIFD